LARVEVVANRLEPVIVQDSLCGFPNNRGFRLDRNCIDLALIDDDTLSVALGAFIAVNAPPARVCAAVAGVGFLPTANAIGHPIGFFSVDHCLDSCQE
jgi:hypothetical protein